MIEKLLHGTNRRDRDCRGHRIFVAADDVGCSNQRDFYHGRGLVESTGQEVCRQYGISGAKFPRKVPQAGDADPPTCDLTHFGDQLVKITVQDVDSGLATIELVPPTHSVDLLHLEFDVGTTDPVVVRFKRKNPDWAPRIQLEIIDVAGNVTHCILDGPHLRIVDNQDGNGH